jgi:hypothetical protein
MTDVEMTTGALQWELSAIDIAQREARVVAVEAEVDSWDVGFWIRLLQTLGFNSKLAIAATELQQGPIESQDYVLQLWEAFFAAADMSQVPQEVRRRRPCCSTV